MAPSCSETTPSGASADATAPQAVVQDQAGGGIAATGGSDHHASRPTPALPAAPAAPRPAAGQPGESRVDPRTRLIRALRRVSALLLGQPGGHASGGRRLGKGKAAGILRSAAKGGRRQAGHVRWKEQMAVDQSAARDADAGGGRQRDDAALERQERLRAYYFALRLPALTYEMLAIPLRIAFAEAVAASTLFIFLDAMTDLYEIDRMVRELSAEARARRALPQATRERAGVEAYPYACGRFALDALTVAVLHASRAAFVVIGGDSVWLWYAAQAVRAIRIHDLNAHVEKINSDLTTSVMFLAVYKFSLVMFAVPHWVACAWWAISTHAAELELPTWSAQYQAFSGQHTFDPQEASALEQYLLASFMAWSGVTALGYGPLVIATEVELAFSCLICVVQIVFYAFVLGTLFHYLVRVDETVLHFKEQMKAVEDYCAHRSLPAPIVHKIRVHFRFQHRKNASGKENIFNQLPHTLKVRVASAQHLRHVQGAWIFASCHGQFLNQMVIVLRERHVMPYEALFHAGDGSRELLFLIGGSLSVRRGDVHITTVRSDLEPGQVVGEVAFILGIQQPYTVAATSTGDVTLLVLPGSDYDEIVQSYPEQADVIMQNLLRRFGLDKNGKELPTGDAGGGSAFAHGAHSGTLDDEEREEFDALRQTIKHAIVRRNEDALSQMTYAASEGDVDTVRTMASRGLPLDIGDYDGRTTLHLAAAEGNIKVVSLLLSLGADPNVRDRWGGTPIKDAIEGKHEAVAAELARVGAHLDIERPAGMLCEAASKGDVNYIATLLANGIDINVGDYDGRTAMHLAAAEGNLRVCEYMISRLADVNVEDRWNRTPVDDAIENGRKLVAQLLRDSGGRPRQRGLAEKLCDAASNSELHTLSALIDAGVSVDGGDYDMRTALHLAAAAGSLSGVHVLLASMADPNVADRWGNTPLVDALENSLDVACLLVHEGATLPPAAAADAQISARLAEARERPKYSVNRELSRRKAARLELDASKLKARQELSQAFDQLAHEITKLRHLHDTLYKYVRKWTPHWVDTYAVEQGDEDNSTSDLTSDDLEQSEDESEEDEEDDDGSGDGGGGGGGPGREANGVHSRNVHVTGGSSAGAGGGRAANGAPASATNATASFTRLLLQLPRVERGLRSMSALFDEVMSAPAMLGEDTATRDEAAVRNFLARCQVPKEAVEAMLAELYAELQQMLGAAAPARPARQPSSGPMSGGMPRRRISAFAARLASANGGRQSGRQSIGQASSPTSGRASREASPMIGSRLSSGREAPIAGISALGGRSSTHDGSPDAGRRFGTVRRGSGAIISLLTGTRVKEDSESNDQALPSDADVRVSLRELGFKVLLLSGRFVDHVLDVHARGGPAALASRGNGGPDTHANLDDDSADYSQLNWRLVSRLKQLTKDHAAGTRVHPSGGDSEQARESDGLPSPPSGARSGLRSPPPGAGGGFLSPPPRGPRASSFLRRSFQQGCTQQQPKQSTATEPQPTASGGELAARSDLRAVAELIEAVELLSRLFALFDVTGKGMISIKDVRRMQGSVGDLGSREIKSLLVFLSEAAASFAAASAAAHDGSDNGSEEDGAGRRAPRRQRLPRSQFLVGAADWVLATAGSGDDEDELDDAAHAGAAGLSTKGLIALENAGAMNGSCSGSLISPTNISQMSVASSCVPFQFKPDAALAASTAMRVDVGAMMTPQVRIAVVDKIKAKFASGRLQADALVNVDTLAAIIGSCVTKSSVTPGAVLGWCTTGLELNVQGTGDNAATWAALADHLLPRSGARRALAAADEEPAFVGAGGARAGTFADRVYDAAQRSRALSAKRHAEANAALTANFAHSDSSGWASSIILAHEGGAHSRFMQALLLAAAWNALLLPVQLCFLGESQKLPGLLAVNYVCDVVYAAKLALGFITTFTDAEASVTVADPRKMRTHYLSTDFAPDAIAVVPLDLFALLLGAAPWLALMLRLPRLLHTRYVRAAYRAWEKQSSADNLLVGLLHYLCILAIAAHYAACVWNVLGYHAGTAHAWPDLYYSGVESIDGDVPDFGSSRPLLLRQYLTSLYFMLAVVTTLGLPQLPANYFELAYVILMMLGNMTVYAWAVGKISALVMKQDDEIVSKRSQLELVQWYVTHIRVPDELKHDVEVFFQSRLEDASLSSIQDEDVYRGMPIALQIEVSKYTNRALVGGMAILRGCTDNFLDRFASVLRERSVEQEQVLFRTGELSKELYVVDSGLIEVYDYEEDVADNGDMVATSGPAETVGELPFFFGLRHFNNARAAPGVETKLFVLVQDDYRMLHKIFPLQGDIVLNTIMHTFDGAFTARSARSKLSGAVPGTARSTGSAFDKDGAESSMGESVIGAEVEVNAIQKMITEAKSKRIDGYIVRLCDASAKGDVAEIQQLVTANSLDVNMGDYDKRRALHLAASEGHLKAVQLLIALHADVNVQDRYGSTPLQDALRHGQDQAGSLLREQGATLSLSDAAERLCYAASRSEGFAELKALLAYGCDPSAADYDMRTAMHVAAAEGRVDNLKLLVEHGADVNVRDRWGGTPLQEAFSHGQAACSELLLELQASFGQFDVAANMCAAAAKDDVAIMKRLIGHRCSPNDGDYDKRRPLHLAAANGQLAATHFLLEQDGIDVNVEDRFGNTPLDDAEREDVRAGQAQLHAVVVTLLKRKGGKPGSHEKHVQMGLKDDDSNEKQLVARDSRLIQRQTEMMTTIEQMRAWIKQDGTQSRKLRQRLDVVLRLQHEQGDVITDVYPKFWPELQLFAEGHRERRRYVSQVLRATVNEWQRTADEFAFASTHDMSQNFDRMRVDAVHTLQEDIAQTFDRLLGADFRTQLDANTVANVAEQPRPAVNGSFAIKREGAAGLQASLTTFQAQLTDGDRTPAQDATPATVSGYAVDIEDDAMSASDASAEDAPAASEAFEAVVGVVDAPSVQAESGAAVEEPRAQQPHLRTRKDSAGNLYMKQG